MNHKQDDLTATVQGDVRPAAATGARAIACLVVLSGWEIGRVVELAPGKTVIGRSEEADILIPEPLISRRHARVLHLRVGANDLYEVTDLGDAALLAEQLRTTGAEHRFEHDGNEFSVTISQGLAQCPEHGTTAEELISSADGALYAAKAAGRNCVRSA